MIVSLTLLAFAPPDLNSAPSPPPGPLNPVSVKEMAQRATLPQLEISCTLFDRQSNRYAIVLSQVGGRGYVKVDPSTGRSTADRTRVELTVSRDETGKLADFDFKTPWGNATYAEPAKELRRVFVRQLGKSNDTQAVAFVFYSIPKPNERPKPGQGWLIDTERAYQGRASDDVLVGFCKVDETPQRPLSPDEVQGLAIK